MSEELVIGVDCSTTSSKAIVFNKAGEIICSSSEPIKLFSPKENYYEQNAEDWWTSVITSLKKITTQINPEKIKALAIANQRETFTILDESGNCIRPAIIWLDERCKDEVEPFSVKIGKKKIHSITGKPVDYAPVVYRLAWLKKHEKEQYKKISMVADVHTYITWKLTGKFKTSWSSADPLGMFDLKNKKWSQVILKELRLKNEQLPETFSPGTILGKISDEASQLTGLNRKTLVVAGGGDGQSAGLGANVLKSNIAYLNLGTAVVAGIYGSYYKTSNAFRTIGSCTSGGYYFETSLRAGTFAIDWFIKNILKIDSVIYRNIYNKLDEEAQNIPLGSGGLKYLPYICGVMNPYWDIDARGSFIGITSSHTRGHFYRSILEGIAFEQLFALEETEKAAEIKVKRLAAMGGGTVNELWLRIIADVTGREIIIPGCKEASALGAAINAAVASGFFKDHEAAAKSMTSIERVIMPDKKNHKTYQKYFTEYKKIYRSIKNLKVND